MGDLLDQFFGRNEAFGFVGFEQVMAEGFFFGIESNANPVRLEVPDDAFNARYKTVYGACGFSFQGSHFAIGIKGAE